MAKKFEVPEFRQPHMKWVHDLIHVDDIQEKHNRFRAYISIIQLEALCVRFGMTLDTSDEDAVRFVCLICSRRFQRDARDPFAFCSSDLHDSFYESIECDPDSYKEVIPLSQDQRKQRDAAIRGWIRPSKEDV